MQQEELNNQNNLQSEEVQNKNDDKQNGSSQVKKGIAIGVSAFFGVILLVFLSLLIAGFQFYYVITSSMSPTIYQGQMVIVNTNIDKNNLGVGDIVTFTKGAQTVTHRIIEVCYDENGNVYYMQAPDLQYRQMLGENTGTNQMNAQSPVYVNEIIGRVVTIGGKPIKLYILASIVGLFNGAGVLNFIKVVLGITIIILVIWTIASYIKNKQKKDKTDNK